MTDFERQVFGSLYAAEFTSNRRQVPYEGDELVRAKAAFEEAMLGLFALRRLKIEPVFGAGIPITSNIEAEVLSMVGADAPQDP